MWIYHFIIHLNFNRLQEGLVFLGYVHETFFFIDPDWNWFRKLKIERTEEICKNRFIVWIEMSRMKMNISK